MDRIKRGKFIKQKRNEICITQSDLSEKLGVSDRTILKWENGICITDSSLIPELCKI